MIKRGSRLSLLLMDVVLLLASFSVFYSWRVGHFPYILWRNPTAWGFSSTLILLVYIFGGYEIERFQSERDAFLRLLWAAGIFGLIATLLVYLGLDQRAGLFGRGVLIGGLATFFASAGLMRWLLYHSLASYRSRATWLFAVSRRWMGRLQKDLKTSRFAGQLLFVDETELDKVRALFDGKRMNVVVGFERGVFESHRELFSGILNARVQGHMVMDLVSFYERYWLKVPVHVVAPEWLIQPEGFSIFRMPLQARIKRTFDIFISLVLLTLLWPLMLLAAALIRLDSAGPVFYRQVRTGRDGEPFVIFKFRSMRQDAEKDGARWAQVGDPRVTRLGRILRKARIDELPQIFNVLKGEMSFVGPRPERPEFNADLSREIPFYDLRHLVRPGITGWAQILYPYGASKEDAWEKLQYDLYYIKNHSFWLDLKVALKTARVMVLGGGR